MRQVVACKRLKTLENYKVVSFKSAGCVAYKRWSFMRGCNYRALTGKN